MHQHLRRRIALRKFRMRSYKLRRGFRQLGRAYHKASGAAQEFSEVLGRVPTQQ